MGFEEDFKSYKPPEEGSFEKAFHSAPVEHKANPLGKSLALAGEDVAAKLFGTGLLGSPEEHTKAAEYRQHEDRSNPVDTLVRRAVPIAHGAAQSADNLINFAGAIGQSALGIPEHHRLTSQLGAAIGNSKLATELRKENPDFYNSMAHTSEVVAPLPSSVGGLAADAALLAAKARPLAKTVPFLSLASKALAKPGVHAADVIGTNALLAGTTAVGEQTGRGENPSAAEFGKGAVLGGLGAGVLHGAGHVAGLGLERAKGFGQEILKGKKPIEAAPNHMQTVSPNASSRVHSGQMSPAQVEEHIRKLGLEPEVANEFRAAQKASAPQPLPPTTGVAHPGAPRELDMWERGVLPERPIGPIEGLSGGVEGRSRAARYADSREIPRDAALSPYDFSLSEVGGTSSADRQLAARARRQYEPGAMDIPGSNHEIPAEQFSQFKVKPGEPLRGLSGDVSGRDRASRAFDARQIAELRDAGLDPYDFQLSPAGGQDLVSRMRAHLAKAQYTDGYVFPGEHTPEGSFSHGLSDNSRLNQQLERRRNQPPKLTPVSRETHQPGEIHTTTHEEAKPSAPLRATPDEASVQDRIAHEVVKAQAALAKEQRLADKPTITPVKGNSRRVLDLDVNGKPLLGHEAAKGADTFEPKTTDQVHTLERAALATLQRQMHEGQYWDYVAAVHRLHNSPGDRPLVFNGVKIPPVPPKGLDFTKTGQNEYDLFRNASNRTQLGDVLPAHMRGTPGEAYVGEPPSVPQGAEEIGHEQHKLALAQSHDDYIRVMDETKKFMGPGDSVKVSIPSWNGEPAHVKIEHVNETQKMEPTSPEAKAEIDAERVRILNSPEGGYVTTHKPQVSDVVGKNANNRSVQKAATFLGDWGKSNSNPFLSGLARRGAASLSTEAAGQSLLSIADAGAASAADGSPEEQERDKAFYDSVRGAGYFLAGLGAMSLFSNRAKETALKEFSAAMQGGAGKLARLYGDLTDHAQHADQVLGKVGDQQLSRQLMRFTTHSVMSNLGVHFPSQNAKAQALGLLNRKEISLEELNTRDTKRFLESPFAQMNDQQIWAVRDFHLLKQSAQNTVARYVADMEHRVNDKYVDHPDYDKTQNLERQEAWIAEQDRLKKALGASRSSLKGLAQHLIQGNTGTTGLDMLTSRATMNSMDFFFLQNPAHHLINMTDSMIMGSAEFGPVRMARAMHTLATDPEMRAAWHDSNIFGNFRQERADLASKFPNYLPPKFGEDLGSDTFNAAATGVMAFDSYFDRNLDQLTKLGFKNSSEFAKAMMNRTDVSPTGQPIPVPLQLDAMTDMITHNMKLMGADPLGINMNAVRASKFGGAALSFLGQPIRVARYVNLELSQGNVRKVGNIFLLTALLGGPAALDATLKGVAEHLDPGAMAAIEQGMHSLSIPGALANILGPSAAMFIPYVGDKLSNSAVNPLSFGAVNLGMEGGLQAVKHAEDLVREPLQGKTENVPANAYKLAKSVATVAMPRVPGLGIGTGTTMRVLEGLGKSIAGKDTFYTNNGWGQRPTKNELSLPSDVRRASPLLDAVVPGLPENYYETNQSNRFGKINQPESGFGLLTGHGQHNRTNEEMYGYGQLHSK